MNAIARVPLCLLLCLMARSVDADPPSAIVGIETGYTDNVNLTKDKLSDAPFEIFVGFDYSGRSARTEGAFNGRLGYRSYLEGNAADELKPNLHGNLVFHLQPERLAWVVDGDWRQTRLDRLGPDSPANLESQVVIWTGPDVLVPLSPVTTLTAKGRAGYSYNSDSSEQSEPDDYRLGGELDLTFRRSRSESISANLEVRSVNYVDRGGTGASASDFRIADLFVGYRSRGAQSDLDVQIGSSLASEDDGSDRTGLFGRVDASGALGRRGLAGLRLNLGFDDQANATLEEPIASGVAEPIEAQVSGFYYQQRVEAYYSRAARRADLLGSLFAESRDFVGATNDETNYGAAVSWNARLSRSSSAGVYGRVEYTDYQDLSENTRLYRVGIQFGRRLSRHVSAKSEIRYEVKTSNDEALEYDETAVFVSLVYRFRL